VLQAQTLASENFAKASRAYAKAAEKSPHLKQLYQDYALYMMAWSRIELAKAHHRVSEFFLAGKYNREAAKILRLTKRWSDLADHYLAMAKLELAENYSRDGNSAQAVRNLAEAARDFKKIRMSSHRLLTMVDQASEREMIENLTEPLREEYCLARIMLEEARIAENKHDYSSASEKYGLAGLKFDEISKGSRLVRERNEAIFQASLAKAWQALTRARLDNSAGHMLEAHALFRSAKLHASDENARLLASGHEHFCRGLMASSTLADETNLMQHKTAASQFEVSEKCYWQAGYQTAAANASARKLLLQASVDILRGNMHTDSRQKTPFIESATKLLKRSAEAFDQAGQPDEKMFALHLSERAKKERNFSLQLTEILNFATPTKSNFAVSTSGQNTETPGGFERFEQASIEATIHMPIEANPQTALEYEIRVTNIGTQNIRLVTIDDVVPDGAEVGEIPENWIVNGRSIESLQTTIAPFKQEVVRISLKPSDGTNFVEVRPTITFTDERNSQHRVVLEERTMLPSRIMRFLAHAFVMDCEAERISLDECGWRTLMRIVKAMKIPRSHVYGEPRYGRPFGKQLDSLMQFSLTESRAFLGERGRGGEVLKVRAKYSNHGIKKYIDELQKQ
jgi:hypothetical protein